MLIGEAMSIMDWSKFNREMWEWGSLSHTLRSPHIFLALGRLAHDQGHVHARERGRDGPGCLQIPTGTQGHEPNKE